MRNEPRLSQSAAALALFLACGPLPAAAQSQVKIGAASNAAIPVVPALGVSATRGSGALAGPLTQLGLTAALAAPSAAPMPLGSAIAAAAAPSARAVVARQAAAVPGAAQATVIPAPGAAATSLAAEYIGAASKESPSAQASDPASRSLAGRILDTLLHRPAAAVSFDGARDRDGAVDPAAARSGMVWSKAMLDTFLGSNGAAIRGVPGVEDIRISETGPRPMLTIVVAEGRSAAAVKASVEAKVPSIQSLNGVMGSPAQVRYRHAPAWHEKILTLSRYQGFDVKVQYEEGIAVENLNMGLPGKSMVAADGRVTEIFSAPTQKRAAELARTLAGYDLVETVSVSRSVAWRLDEDRRPPASGEQRFENAELAGRAVAKIKELFSGVRSRGQGEYTSRQGRREKFADVSASLVDASRPDRVTLALSHRWPGTGARYGNTVTLIAGERPAIIVGSKSGAWIFPRTNHAQWVGLSVGKESVVLRLEALDGSIASYEIKRRSDGGIEFKQAGYAGVDRVVLPKKRP